MFLEHRCNISNVYPEYQNMKSSICLLLVLTACFPVHESDAQEVYELWEGLEMPFYKENNISEIEKEIYGITAVFNVTIPTLTVYRVKGENTSKAVIICPGGGYAFEAIHHEGYDIAKVLSAAGITAAVLKYRLPDPETSTEPYRVPITDARRSLKLLREKAYEYGINTSAVGIMGFSAGSHLATAVSVWESNDTTENADFSVLVYGVTSNKPGNLKWLEESLFYRKMSDAEIVQNSFVDLVSETTPPTFLVHAYDDSVCHVSESTDYAQKLSEHGVPLEMHLFSKGGHGFGGGRSEDGTDQWLPLLVKWLELDWGTN